MPRPSLDERLTIRIPSELLKFENELARLATYQLVLKLRERIKS